VLRFAEKQEGAGAGWINTGIYLFARSRLAAIEAGRASSLERDVLPAGWRRACAPAARKAASLTSARRARTPRRPRSSAAGAEAPRVAQYQGSHQPGASTVCGRPLRSERGAFASGTSSASVFQTSLKVVSRSRKYR
jgi:hypothetical protein